MLPRRYLCRGSTSWSGGARSSEKSDSRSSLTDPGAPIVALTAEIAAFRMATESQRERIGKLTETVAAPDARIAEVEKLLDDSRRSGRRQAAPFSKGEHTDEPKRRVGGRWNESRSSWPSAGPGRPDRPGTERAVAVVLSGLRWQCHPRARRGLVPYRAVSPRAVVPRFRIGGGVHELQAAGAGTAPRKAI